MCVIIFWGAHESFMYPIFVLKNGCDIGSDGVRVRVRASSMRALRTSWSAGGCASELRAGGRGHMSDSLSAPAATPATSHVNGAWDLQRRHGNDVRSPNVKIAGFFGLFSRVYVVSKTLSGVWDCSANFTYCSFTKT
jgi:hypothetical protein